MSACMHACIHACMRACMHACMHELMRKELVCERRAWLCSWPAPPSRPFLGAAPCMCVPLGRTLALFQEGGLAAATAQCSVEWAGGNGMGVSPVRLQAFESRGTAGPGSSLYNARFLPIQCKGSCPYNAIHCKTMHYTAIQCNTMQYNAMQYDAIRCPH